MEIESPNFTYDLPEPALGALARQFLVLLEDSEDDRALAATEQLFAALSDPFTPLSPEYVPVDSLIDRGVQDDIASDLWDAIMQVFRFPGVADQISALFVAQRLTDAQQFDTATRGVDVLALCGARIFQAEDDDIPIDLVLDDLARQLDDGLTANALAYARAVFPLLVAEPDYMELWLQDSRPEVAALAQQARQAQT